MATATARGIIVRVSVYSSFAILDVALDVDVDDAERSAALPKGGAHSIFAVKFSPSDTPAAAAAADGAGILPPSRTVVRSVGRDCKVGDLIEAIGVWLPPEELKAGSPPRFHITCVTHVFVLEMRRWTSTHVQKVRERFLGNNHEGADDVKRGTQQQRRQLQQQKKDKKAKQKQKQDSGSGSGSGSCCGGSDHEKHGTTGGAEKRRQGEVVAQFLVDILAGLSSTTTMLATRSPNRPADGAASAGGDVGSKAIPHDDAGVAAPDDAGVAAALQHRLRAAKLLNAGTGVIDVAGGSGHVSLAFALRGIRATVVDPRDTVGCLPGRDTKVLKKAIKRYAAAAAAAAAQEGVAATSGNALTAPLTSNLPQQAKTSTATAPIPNHALEDAHSPSPPPLRIHANPATVAARNQLPPTSPPPKPVPFSTLRAWFGGRVDGADCDFPGGDVAVDSSVVPACTADSDDGLLSSCSAVVALHPDEATGAVVDYCISARKPFVVVPCCVFARLFPDRKTATGAAVATHAELVKYLASKDPAIHTTALPFQGANVALWATFEDD